MNADSDIRHVHHSYTTCASAHAMLMLACIHAARDGVENWELTEMKSLRDESPVMEQLWKDAIVELESELGRDWKGLMHHHSMSDPTYIPRS